MRLTKLMLVSCLPLLLGCAKQPTTKDKDFAEYYNICLEIQFHIDYGEQTIITIDTKEHEDYYLSNVYYRKDFENNIYLANYIGAINSENELILRKVIIDE